MPGPFFFFALIVELVTLATAVRFAFRPAEKTLSILRPLCAATAFSSLAAFFLGIANGLAGFSRVLERATDPASTAQAYRMLVGGLAEAPAALILGFAFLAVSWLLAAVGLSRQA